MVVKQVLFLLADNLHDTIVVSDNQHYVFAQNSQLLFSGVKFDQRLRESYQTMSLNFIPILDFNKKL
jgi:hypothetical protein